MKRDILVQIAHKLNTFSKINSIERVNDTLIKMLFNKEVYYIDMQRGDAYIFKKQTPYKRLKNYNAPFDVVLKKRLTNAKIERIEVEDGNKILRFYLQAASKYKEEKVSIQFEFTGRNTNIILLDNEGVILEALRHIDSETSFREVRVGVKLEPLPAKDFENQPIMIEDLDVFLFEEYERRERQTLVQVKKQKIASLLKKSKKLHKILQNLDDEVVLLDEATSLEYDANLILANIHTIKNYEKEIQLQDYEGEMRTIMIPTKAQTPSQAANLIFTQSKKRKQKAKNVHIERDNLQSKIGFLEQLVASIESATSVDEVNLYLPKQPKKQKSRAKVDSNIESFFIEGVKISLGKNEKGNITLLKEAKMGDIWLHLKDMPSTHVIIRTDKQQVPESVLMFAAKLCVQFSATSAGNYLVDYTQRRHVKMREGANVNYVEYKTLKVDKTR
jgi:predicted ribosome quality control (RQC) complex YloA/Tae2 family protein